MKLRGPALIVLAAFGPYLALGLRTEQVVIYALTAATVLGALTFKWHPGLIGLAALWGAILTVSVVSGVFPPAPSKDVSPLSGIDALLAPLCVMIVMAIWSARRDRVETMFAIQKWTICLLALNAILAFSMTFYDLTGFLSAHWWLGGESAGDARTVGEAAAVNGRFGGVFNSPLAAGTAYSVGLVALIHLYLSKVWGGRWVLLMAALILVGGFLPQSKAFLFAGVPIAIVVLFAGSSERRIGRLLTLGAAVAATAWAVTQTNWWLTYGSYRYAFLFSDVKDPVTLYTAGRYGDNAAIGSRWDYVMETAPWAGYGTRVNIGALDTSWLEMLGRAGLIGLAAFIAWIAVVALMWLNRRSLMPRHSWWATGGMIGVLIAAAAGGPALTQNRAGTLLLLNLLALLACTTAAKHEERPGPVVTRIKRAQLTP